MCRLSQGGVGSCSPQIRWQLEGLPGIQRRRVRFDARVSAFKITGGHTGLRENGEFEPGIVQNGLWHRKLRLRAFERLIKAFNQLFVIKRFAQKAERPGV